MMLQDALLVLLAAFLVLLNGFFVASEFAIVKLRRTRVEQLQHVHGLRGRILWRVHARMDAYLSACQLGITLASLGLGWVGEPAFASLLQAPLQAAGVEDPELLHTIGFVVAFSLISFLHIVVGELAPKSMAIRMPEAMSLWTALPLYAFYWLMYPAIWLLNASANAILRRAGLELREGHGHEAPYSHDELRTILHLSRPATEETNPVVHNLLTHSLELPELRVSDVMHGRHELVAIYDDDSHADVHRTIMKHRFSRYPLMERQTDEVLGVLLVKDIFAEPAGEDFQARLRRHLLPVERVREHDSLLALLRRFRQGAPHLAIVVGVSDHLEGFVTMEDLIEVILGDITDEHEARRGSRFDRRPIRLPDGSLLVRGDLPVFRLERELGTEIEEANAEDVSTVAGLLMSQLERLPEEGDRVRFGPFALVAARVRGRRVELVRVFPHSRTR